MADTPEPQIATKEEVDKARENYAVYAAARDDGHSDYVKVDEKANRYYRGDQWDAEDAASLKEQKKPMLTINMFLSTVNALLGEHRSHRADVAFRPFSHEATSEAASALSKLWLQISHNNKLDWRQGEVFKDGILGGRGYFDVRMDWSDNVQGELRITTKDPKQIILDPDACDYDPEEWGYVIDSPWMSLDRIRLVYGDEAYNKIKYSGMHGGAFSGDQIETYRTRFGKNDPQIQVTVDHEDEKHRVRSVRVIDRQYRELNRTLVLVDPTTGDWKIPPKGWDARRTEEFAFRAGLATTRRLISRIRWLVTAGNATLFDDWSPYDSFTIVPYFGFWTRGNPFGLGENLFSPQDQLNKTSSQELHVINTTANSGYKVPAGSLVNMTPQELERRGAETGIVLEYNPVDGLSPEKIQPNQIPAGLAHVAQKSAMNFRVISGVNEGQLGMDGERASGVALDKKRQGGLVQMEVPFDNFKMTMNILARVGLGMIQKYYTGPRMFRIINPATRSQEPEVVEINTPDVIGQIKNNITLGEYDVAVSMRPARETVEDTQFAEALQLRREKVMIPDHVVIENSHLEGRMEIAEEVKRMQGLAEPTPEEQQLAQMQMQIQMETAQAEVRKLNAQAAQFEANAQQLMAKAMKTAGEPDLEMQRIAADLEKQARDIRAAINQKLLDIRENLALAKMHTNTKRDTTIYQTSAKRISDELKMQASLASKPPTTPTTQR